MLKQFYFGAVVLLPPHSSRPSNVFTVYQNFISINRGYKRYDKNTLAYFFWTACMGEKRPSVFST